MKITFMITTTALVFVLLFESPSSAPADTRCPSTASACHYDVPASVRSARDTCERTEANQRGIPTDRDLYVTWWYQHQGTEQLRSWGAAVRACTHNHTQPGGLWNWSGLTYLGSD